jgi:RNA polymerase sigma factor (sigma-70 family)
MGPPGRRGEEWFTAIYAAHYPLIVRYGLRRLADMDASVELAQDVFVVAWQRRSQVPDHSLPWLYGVARRLLANRWRARRCRPDPVLTDPDLMPDTPAGEADHDAAIRQADIRAVLATLGDLDQEILRLVGWEGLTLAEVATALDCSRATAAVRLHRARRRLVAALDEPTGTTAPRPRPARSGKDS